MKCMVCLTSRLLWSDWPLTPFHSPLFSWLLLSFLLLPFCLFFFFPPRLLRFSCQHSSSTHPLGRVSALLPLLNSLYVFSFIITCNPIVSDHLYIAVTSTLLSPASGSPGFQTLISALLLDTSSWLSHSPKSTCLKLSSESSLAPSQPISPPVFLHLS